MGYTRRELRNRLTGLVGSGRFGVDQLNEAINLTIESAWPTIRVVKEDTSQTIDQDTFTYSLTATDIREQGVAQLWAQESSKEDTLLRRALQASINGTWKIYLTSDQASSHHGKTLIARYETAHARLTDDATTESDVPVDYVVFRAAYLCSIIPLTDLPDELVNYEGFQAAGQLWLQEAERRLAAQRTTPLTHYIGYRRL